MQAGTLLGAGRKNCDGFVMTWTLVPLPGTKLGLLSLGWLQGEGCQGIVTHVNSIFKKKKKNSQD